jgi:hypothetical protein
MSYWWTRLAVRIVVFCTLIALALIVLEWAVWFLLGIFAGYLLWVHRNKSERYAAKDQHYE